MYPTKNYFNAEKMSNFKTCGLWINGRTDKWANGLMDKWTN